MRILTGVLIVFVLAVLVLAIANPQPHYAYDAGGQIVGAVPHWYYHVYPSYYYRRNVYIAPRVSGYYTVRPSVVVRPGIAISRPSVVVSPRAVVRPQATYRAAPVYRSAPPATNRSFGGSVSRPSSSYSRPSSSSFGGRRR